MSSLLKKILLTLMVCLVGVIVMKGIAIYLDKVRVPPMKQIASKPKNFNKTYKSVEPQELIKDEYTFFNTLHDPSMQKFVGLEGIVEKKNEVANDKLMALDINKANSRDVKLNDPIVKNNIQPINKNLEIGKINNMITPGFSLQVGSFKKIELAEFLESDLENKGYSVYVESALINEMGQVWYRVFIGRFSAKTEAEKIGIKVKKLEGLASVIKWHEGESPKALYD
jgi:hypothetical protein